MKTKNFCITVLLLIALASCKKESVTQDKLPDDMKRLLELSMELQSFRNSDIMHFRNPSGKSNKSGLFKSGKADSDSSGSSYDSTYFNFESCANIINYVDDNGYNVTVLDYGEEGCDEWGSLVKGKIISKWKIDKDNSYFEETYENYETDGMIMNGTFSCSSEDNYPLNDSTGIEDDYEITFICQENLTITYEDGETYTYVSSFKDKFTNNSYTMLEGEFEYSSSTGEKYSFRIVEPVVTNFNCENYLPVSGIEEWKSGDNEYIIDYGNGTCDNIVTVTEDGTTYVINFDEELNDNNVQSGDSTIVGS